ELLRCPSEAELILGADKIDPDAIVRARKKVRESVAASLKGQLLNTYDRLRSNAPFEPTAEQAGERALKNAALSLLVASGEDQIALDQAKTASNMTDEAAATAALAMSASALKEEALDRFYSRWKSDSLVVNKWLAWRAMAPGPNALDEIKRLTQHEAFDASNPNKVRAVIGVFARENLGGFHRADGAGYSFFIDQVLGIDAKNPQLAARLTTSVENWRQFEPGRRALLEKELKRLAGEKGVSANLYEMASRLLGV
ncbi:MAG TPA: aminopeptidase N C-terminal domain-containing protein, partial [Parvularculaceae bacterium]|nr:aminopeptidase N C-terminal domain-containing protein [Parvularculaceae bacterium]